MAQKKSPSITIAAYKVDEPTQSASAATHRIGRRSTQAAPGDTRFLDARTMTPVKMEVPTICDRIRFYREKANMEQKELGSRIGVRGNAICNWENGRGRPDISLLPLICEALNVSLYDLFAIPMPIDKYTSEEQELIQKYRKLSDSHKHVLRGTLANLTEAQEAESRREVIELVYHDKQLAAGFDPGLEFDDTGIGDLDGCPEPVQIGAGERIHGNDACRFHAVAECSDQLRRLDAGLSENAVCKDAHGAQCPQKIGIGIVVGKLLPQMPRC